MDAVRAQDLHRLFNGYRSILDGTCSAATPEVPASLSGYLVDEATGALRPLGQVRQLLLSEIGRCDAVDDLEYAVLALYFGLDLTILPLTARAGQPSVASRLPAAATRLGRPRTVSGGTLGAEGARYLRKRALGKLARAWRPQPAGRPVAPRRVDDPVRSPWFLEATDGWSAAQVSRLLHAALRSARRGCGPFPAIRSELWLDLDWWAHRARLSILSEYGVGRPSTRINAERMARADARMAIALWDMITSDRRRPREPDPPASDDGPRAPTRTAAATLLIPPDEVQDLVAMRDPREAALSAIDMLERQSRRGPLDQGTALVLSWLEPLVVDSLDDEDCGRAVAVLTRAGADHSELAGIGFTWFEVAIRRRVPPRHLAEATLNMSVAFSTRRRYGEAEAVLDRMLERGRHDAGVMSLLAIGRSAWRRRLLSEAIAARRPIGDRQLPALVRRGLDEGAASVALLRAGEIESVGPWLRAEVRKAESLAVASAFLHMTLGSRSAVASVRSQALGMRDSVHYNLTRLRRREPVTAYDLARFEVIDDIAQALDVGAQLTDFGILRRVRRIQRDIPAIDNE
ncbi:hypothetical protein [Dactylosporangium sp. CA-139066]|uniref:hypothetical protein n=1 Tax=Dactylosporangium sp. CA-139066 TaxID=3239930 RepID=UPI003D89EF63